MSNSKIMNRIKPLLFAGIEEKDQKLFWSEFPNPTSETITIKFTDCIIKDQIQI